MPILDYESDEVNADHHPVARGVLIAPKGEYPA